MNFFRADSADDLGHHGLGDFRAAAGENVHSSVAMFRPSVDGDVALCDHNYAAYPLRGKVMEVR